MLHATRIAKKALDFSAGGVAQVKGAIAAAPVPTSNGFTIGSTAVVVNNATVFANMLRTDLATAAGAMVEAKGALTAGVFTATRVEKKQAVEAQLNDNVRVKGIAAGPVSASVFTLNGPNGPITVIAYRTPQGVKITTFRFMSGRPSFGDGPTPFPHGDPPPDSDSD